MEPSVAVPVADNVHKENLVWDIFSTGPILDCLGRHLEVPDIVNISRTCHRLSGLYAALLRQEWNPDCLLKRFVEKPRNFRYQVGQTESLITGSFALEFFSRSSWQAPNLDVVVPDEGRILDLCAYLAEYEQYELVIDTDEYDGGMPHGFRYVDKIFILRCATDSSRIIHLYLISQHAFPLKAIIEGCWSTGLVNFITYRMAYSMFPISTFGHNTSYMLENLGRNWDLPLQKYRDRGIKSEVLHPPVFEQKNHAFQKCRKAGDKFTWKIPFDIKGMDIKKPDPVPEDEIIYLERRFTQLERSSLARLGFPADATESKQGKQEIEPARASATDGADIMKTFHFESELHRHPCSYVSNILARNREERLTSAAFS